LQTASLYYVASSAAIKEKSKLFYKISYLGCIIPVVLHLRF